MVNIILGSPPGGGEADVVLAPRGDGAGFTVVLTRVQYNCTLSEWQRLFVDSIQPSLLHAAGKIPSGLPGHQAIKEARRRAKPGRPPYSPETLSAHLRMWRFCHEHSYLTSSLGSSVFEEFLNSLPDEDRSELEQLDLETFRRGVRRLDRLLRPATDEKWP